MILESLFVILLLIVLTVIFYRSALHEYTILQKDWDAEDVKWSALLSERAPLVVRKVPIQWIRLWTSARTSKFGWPVVIHDDKRVRSNWSIWLNAKSSGLQKIMNTSDLATTAGLHEQAADIALNFRRPFWLPGSFAVNNVNANVIPPTEHAFVGLKKTTAEATAWISTDGAPLRIWIAHEGATKGGDWLPAKPYGRNPWTFKPEETPWISDLKFLEILLRPGNMLILPPHWWVALRCYEPDNTKNIKGAWYWSCEFQSPISWVATRFHNK
jgi:hypothetical protein